MLAINDAPLPVARPDLKLHVYDRDASGQQRWLLQDPIRNQFFRLTERALELLPYVRGDSSVSAAMAASRQLHRTITPEEITQFAEFLRANELVLADAQQQEQFRHQQQQKPTGWRWLLQHYLFIKIPLVNPDPWLSRHYPKVKWLGAKPFLWGLWLIVGLGVWLTVHQWDQVMADLPEIKSASGLFTLGLALVLIKIAHELGHAFVCKSKGCQVPNLGVAFIVGWPVLYTDTSDSWRLRHANDRVQIDLAGVLVELGIAAIALLLWHVLPPSLLRDLCFWWASTTWVMSILVNFNPLMRFDGYYLLSDLWQEINLDQRSQALARWQLREWLFGWGEQPPECPKKRLIVFAFIVWGYRLLLYIGIALLVYHFFIKLLGIFLFVVEIWVFIMRPLLNEARYWFAAKQAMRWNLATVRTAIILALLVGLVILPWRSSTVLPAYLTFPTQNLEAPFSGRVHFLVDEGRRVDQNTTLLRISSPSLEHHYQQSVAHIKSLQWQFSVSGLHTELLLEKPLLRADWLSWQNRSRALAAQKRSGELVAQQAASVQTYNHSIQPNGWVSEGEWLGTLQYEHDHPRLSAWVKEEDVLLLSLGQTATFFARRPLDTQSIQAKLIDIGRQAVTRIEPLAMAKHYGGVIPTKVTQNSPEEGAPLSSWYRLEWSPLLREGDNTQTIDAWRHLAATPRMGEISVKTRAQSFLERFWRIIVSVWRMESGF